MTERMMARRWRLFTVGMSALITTAAMTSAAHAQTLYDGTNTTNPLPEQQGWLAYGSIGSATETYNTAGSDVSVNTYLSTPSNVTNYAGYSNYSSPTTMVNSSFPTLNSAAGFTLNFTVQNASDPITFSTSHPRSALSVILLDSNHMGVEIGIRPDLIFAQNSTFTGVAQTTGASTIGAGLTSYSISVLGTSFTLSNAGTPLFTGTTTQFSSTGDPGSTVYTRNNFLFIGDDTTSDGGTYNIKSVSVIANSAAPEPESLALSLLGMGLLLSSGRALSARTKAR